MFVHFTLFKMFGAEVFDRLSFSSLTLQASEATEIVKVRHGPLNPLLHPSPSSETQTTPSSMNKVTMLFSKLVPRTNREKLTETNKGENISQGFSLMQTSISSF